MSLQSETSAAKRLVISQWFRTRKQFFRLILAAATLVFTAARVTAWGPTRGDIAVWSFVHEWLDRGSTLYTQVWDHKDFGFFMITHPLYHYFGVLGLYIAGFGSVGCFFWGIYLCLRTTRQGGFALVTACLATIAYVSAPSFLAVYTEPLALGLFCLAFGCLVRWPFISGLIFALSVSVKVNVVLLYALVLIVLLVSARHLSPERSLLCQSQSRRNVLGFVLGIGAVFLYAFAAGSLGGWVEATNFNGQYSAYRRRGLQDLHSVGDFWNFINPGNATVAFLAGLTLVFAVGLIYAKKLWPSHRDSSTVEIWICLLRVSVSLVIGSAILLVLQLPPYFQHYQFLVGIMVMSTALCFSGPKECEIAQKPARIDTLRFILLLPACVAILVAPSSFSAGRISQELQDWQHLSAQTTLANGLVGIRQNSNLMILGGNASRIPIEALPNSVILSCRFFFEFSHMLPQYRTEIETCLHGNPDYVLVDRGEYWGDEGLRSRSQRFMETYYRRCSVSDDTYILWARSQSLCPVAKGLVS